MCQIYSSIGADLTFKGLSIFLHSKLVFSKARDSINTHLASESVTPVFIPLVNLGKKSLKGSLWPCMILAYDSILLAGALTMSQAFKAAVWHGKKCVYCK